MKLCPNRSAAEEHSLKRGLLPSHGRIRRGPEGSSRNVDVRRRWGPRVETTTGTPCLVALRMTYGRGHRLLREGCTSTGASRSYRSTTSVKHVDPRSFLAPHTVPHLRSTSAPGFLTHTLSPGLTFFIYSPPSERSAHACAEFRAGSSFRRSIS